MAVACAMAGAISAFKSLEYMEVTRHEDGVKKTYMTLCLGPFEYKFEIPKKGGKKTDEMN